MTAPGTIAVLGEALIDLVEAGDDEPRLARPGGGPYNVAIGLARLGQPASFVGRLSRDPLGRVLRRHATRSDVDLSLSVDALEPTTVALVELTGDGVASYVFGVDGTADFRWTDAELDRVPDTVAALHFGSLTSWTPPGDAAVLRRVAALRHRVLISYDPNVRPRLQTDSTRAREQVEAALATAQLAKTSDEDLAYLYPDADVDDIARGWLRRGPDLVVVTRGARGSTAYTSRDEVTQPAHVTTVVDTVGAGDAFTSGLLDSLARRDALTADRVTAADADLLREVLGDAALIAAITCSRAGANPPRRAEVSAWR